MSDKCRCHDLQQVLVGRFIYRGLRCPHCIDLILEAKNELVRENNALLGKLRDRENVSAFSISTSDAATGQDASERSPR